MREEIVEEISDRTCGEALLLEPRDMFDACLVGMVHQFGRPPVACYSLNQVLTALMRSGMTHEEAVEWFEFNMVGAWVGEFTPAFIETFEETGDGSER